VPANRGSALAPAIVTDSSVSAHLARRGLVRKQTFATEAVAMKNALTHFVRDDAGQDLIEYGLLLGIITLACIGFIKAISGKVATYYSDLSNQLP
jgi:pilus assembly protein Flp/PilA